MRKPRAVKPEPERKAKPKPGRKPGRGLGIQAAAEQLRRERGAALPADPAPLAGHPLPPVHALDRLPAARLLPARYSHSVLTRIADSDADLQLIYALDNATNERLLAEANGRLGIETRELVFEGTYARIVNAAFTHPHPQGARFSSPMRGAWYAAWELPTAKAEVLFHRSVQFTEIGWLAEERLDYDHYSAEFSGGFHDLREAGEPWAACLDPGSYLASQQLAGRLLAAGALGVVYPSARRPGGTCLACFRPAQVHNVRKRGLHRLVWRPDAPASFTRVAREAASGPRVVSA